MSGAGIRFEQFRGDKDGAEPSRAIQELWFSLARTRWSSLVLVPADESVSVSGFARSLAEVGGMLLDAPVTSIVADAMDYESARMLADLQLRVQYGRLGDGSVNAGAGAAAGFPEDAADPMPQAIPPDRQLVVPATRPAAGQVVVAIQPVVVEPLGIAVAHAADAVVLCVKLGRTSLEHARRTIELIGESRFIGAVVVE
jgi:hypothetical protein